MLFLSININSPVCKIMKLFRLQNTCEALFCWQILYWYGTYKVQKRRVAI